MEVVIRTACAADLPELRRVYRHASLSNAGDRDALLAHPQHLEFEGSALDAGGTRVVMVDDHRMLGFATVRPTGATELELDDLFVDPAWHRHGIGRRLLLDAVRTARAGGYLILGVTGNPHAEAFYRSVGFVPAGETMTELGPAPRFRLDLDAG